MQFLLCVVVVIIGYITAKICKVLDYKSKSKYFEFFTFLLIFFLANFSDWRATDKAKSGWQADQLSSILGERKISKAFFSKLTSHSVLIHWEVNMSGGYYFHTKSRPQVNFSAVSWLVVYFFFLFWFNTLSSVKLN